MKIMLRVEAPDTALGEELFKEWLHGESHALVSVGDVAEIVKITYVKEWE